MFLKITTTILFLLSVVVKAHAADVGFEYKLFEGDFGPYGFRAGLLITSTDNPKWLAGRGIGPGDLIVEITSGDTTVGPTLNPSKLDDFLKQLPLDKDAGFEVLVGGGWRPEQSVHALRPLIAVDRIENVEALYGVPEPFSRQSRHIMIGDKVTFENGSEHYFGAIAGRLTEKCNLPSEPADRVIVHQFTTRLALSITLDRSANLSTAAAQKAQQLAATTAGRSLAEELSCQDPKVIQFSQGLPKSLKANEIGEDSNQSKFVTSCTPWHDKEKCACLATQAKAVFENIHDTTYSREAIPALVKRNPAVSVGIAFFCGIRNY